MIAELKKSAVIGLSNYSNWATVYVPTEPGRD